MTTATKSTHVLAPAAQCERLRLLSRVSRVHQSEYLREVACFVLDVYGDNQETGFPPEKAESAGPMASLVFRLHKDDLEALKVLSARTRVRRSEYLRVGLAAVLEKYASVIDRAQEAA